MKKNHTGIPPVTQLKAVPNPSYREPYMKQDSEPVFVGPYNPKRDTVAHCRACQSLQVSVSACPGCEPWKRLLAREQKEAVALGPANWVLVNHRTEHIHVTCSTCRAISLYATRDHALEHERAWARRYKETRAKKTRRWVIGGLIGLLLVGVVSGAVLILVDHVGR